MESDIICNEMENNIPEEISYYLKAALPSGYKSKIIKFNKLTSSTYDLVMRLNIRNKEDALKWLRCYEVRSFTSWRTLRTYPEDSQRIVFKKDFRCHHNTMPKANSVPSEKHTKCSARIKITVKQPLQKLSKDMDLKDRPCEILCAFTHNHELKSAAIFKCRKPKEDVVVEFNYILSEGHSPLYNYLQPTESEQSEIFSFNQASNTINKDELNNTNDEDLATLTTLVEEHIECEKSKNDAKIILKTMFLDIEHCLESNPMEFVPAIKKWADNYDHCKSEASKLLAFYNFGKNSGMASIEKAKNLQGGKMIPTAVARRKSASEGRLSKRLLSSEHCYALAEGKKRKAHNCIGACSENNTILGQ